jgi:tetratricopeptide (TPR) repeat protein
MEQGVALLGAGRFHEAVQQFGLAARQQPLAADARVGLSKACQGIGDGWAATAWLSDACRVAPQRAELWLELVKMLTQQQREGELEPLLRVALALHPQNIPLLQTQAELYLRDKLYAQALASYERLYALQPADRATLLHYGFCLEHTGAVEQAMARYRDAIALDPSFFEAHVDLSGVLWRVEDFDGALAHAQLAVELAPQHPYAARILGTALLNLNQVEEAEAQLRRSLELLPEFPLAELDLAFTLLLAGKLNEGWAMYARRWRDADRLKRPAFFRAELEWKGRDEQPLKGRHIVVYAEQGLGDVIQFVRYVTMMQQDGATVSAVVQPELQAIVEHSLPGVRCLTGAWNARADHHVALLDLPLHYGTTLANVPAQVPYLTAPQDKAARWRARLAPWQGKFKIGLAWSGSRQQVNNNNRALRLSDLMPILALQGVQCFSLQKGDAGPFTDVFPPAGQLVDLTGELADFTDSAAMLQDLDLVISVDTAVAHLAGAMGRPVWVMLAPNADWRWLLKRDDSPWYPSMRMFRRGHGEARAMQVERVLDALKQHMRGPCGA